MKRLLAVDGGGIRGLIPATVLSALEAKAGRPCGELFDLVGGTSTGGIIACGIRSGVPAASLVELYAKRGGEIFKRRWRTYFGLSGPRYDNAGLRTVLSDVLKSAWLGDHLIRAPELIVVSSTIAPTYRPWYFKSWQARGLMLGKGESFRDFDFSLVDVGLSTSAAPTYFPTAEIAARSGRKISTFNIDGGLHANNPSLAVVVSAMQLWPGEPLELLSLGTGTRIHPLDGAASAAWGLAEWAPKLVDLCMDFGSMNSEYWANNLPSVNHQRIQTILPKAASAMDDVSPQNLARLTTLGEQLAGQYALELTNFGRI